jgi:hypothetical protein
MDAFCKDSNAEAKKRNEEFQDALKGVSDPEEQLKVLAPLLADGYEWQQGLDDRFKSHQPPPSDAAIWDKYLTAAEERTALLGRVADAADAGDVDRVTALIDEQGRVDDRMKGIATGYGLKECGSGKNRAK